MLNAEKLSESIMALPIFESAWVLWLLIALSIISLSVMLERVVFFRRRSINNRDVQTKLSEFMSQEKYSDAVVYLQRMDSMETNVPLYGLRSYHLGPDAVEDLLVGAEQKERLRYGRGLSFLATLGSNAPFIGLFGTVLGIIKAFQDLSEQMGSSGTGNEVMAGISEALIATAVGLIVAIPAVVAYNLFTGWVKDSVARTVQLNKIVLAYLKSREV